MANTSSAKKATRKIARRTAVNKSRRTQMRGSVRTVEEAIASGDREAALKAMARAEPELMRAAQRACLEHARLTRDDLWPTITACLDFAALFGVAGAELAAFFGYLSYREGGRTVGAGVVTKILK